MDHQGTSYLLDPVLSPESKQLRLPEMREPLSPQCRGTSSRPMGSAVLTPDRGLKATGTGVPRLGAIIERSHSIEQDDQEYRYFLHRRWGRAGNTALWVVLNPVASKHGMRDGMVDRLTVWSHRWGHSGMLVVSLYPCCARSVDAALRWRDAARGTSAWDHVTAAARMAGQIADRENCTRRLAAWGMLDRHGRFDLETWLTVFDSKAPSECLGVISCRGIADPVHPCARGPARPMPWAEAVPFTYPVVQAE